MSLYCRLYHSSVGCATASSFQNTVMRKTFYKCKILPLKIFPGPIPAKRVFFPALRQKVHELEIFKDNRELYGRKHTRQNINQERNIFLKDGKSYYTMRTRNTETGFLAASRTRGFHACPECGSPRLARTFDETVCRKCGLVVEDTVFV